MSTAALSTEQAPAISVPLRFFVIAPLFLILAAFILATNSVNPFADAHSPALLAATHCITLGFMAFIMFGAMQQILPVMIGSPMPGMARFSLLPLLTGTLSLAGGFVLTNPALLNLACVLLGLAFLLFIAASLISLIRAPAKNASRVAILLSVLTLAMAVTLGIWLARGYATGLPLDYPNIASLHIKMALGGWVMLLIVGVSYQVVPMFQLTANYPKWLSDNLAPTLFIALLLSLASTLSDATTLQALAEGVLCALAGCFAFVTLRLQSRRRRRVADATLNFFRLGMIALLCAAGFLLSAFFSGQLRTLSLIIFILGFALSVMLGMLYKIVPFLVWFHLFRGGMKKGVPNMKEIIPESLMRGHFWLHAATLLALLSALFRHQFIWLVMTGLLLQGILLCIALYTAIAVYRRTRRNAEEVLS
ncbi:MAG: hypothetical protein PHP85_12470 [Gallionella sp.]|nr:hypothetical protein [Gallionella sp.]